jgi:acetylornithine deacetylase/succinyl-diaminopimelate desuccinylase-like protein
MDADAKTEKCKFCARAGPRTVFESNAKRADEHLVLEDLRRATKVIARMLCDLTA